MDTPDEMGGNGGEFGRDQKNIFMRTKVSPWQK